MILKALPLDFHRSPGYAFPVNRELHQMAVRFAEKELVEIPNFSDFTKVWLVTECSGEGTPQSIQGALGFAMRPDFTLNRFLSPDAITVGYERANAYLGDNGAMGQEVLIFMSANELPEQKCPAGLKTLLQLGARPAERFKIKVR